MVPSTYPSRKPQRARALQAPLLLYKEESTYTVERYEKKGGEEINFSCTYEYTTSALLTRRSCSWCPSYSTCIHHPYIPDQKLIPNDGVTHILILNCFHLYLIYFQLTRIIYMQATPAREFRVFLCRDGSLFWLP